VHPIKSEHGTTVDQVACGKLAASTGNESQTYLELLARPGFPSSSCPFSFYPLLPLSFPLPNGDIAFQYICLQARHFLLAYNNDHFSKLFTVFETSV